MGPATVDSSDNASEGDDQTAAWEAEPASLARPRLGVAQAADDLMPHLQTAECGIGHRVRAARSVLALVLDEECVFAGLQGGDIVIWSLETYDLLLSVHAHEESVLGLYLSQDGQLLLSSGGDSVVNVWSTRTFERLYSIYSHHDVGDIFAVVYSSILNTVYCGGQNTSIQWLNLSNTRAPSGPTSAHPSRRAHRFFDSRGPDGKRTPRADLTSESQSTLIDGQALTFKRDHHKLFSHHGYVYAMLLVQGLADASPEEETLLTGGGDGVVKLWRLNHDPETVPRQMGKLQNSDPVLSIAVDGSFLYCGLAGGALNIWNLDSHQLIKRLASHTGDLWAVDIVHGLAICGDSNGVVKKFNSRFEEVGHWTAHEGTMLASATGSFKNRTVYATGGNDNTVGIWDLTEISHRQCDSPPISNDEMVNTLAKFIAFKTISSSPKFAGECNQGAAFLRRHCNYLGAKTKLLITGEETNPIVYARFHANSPNRTDKALLFYGHYDVVSADYNRPRWKTDPYQLVSLDGFLYGRGVSDNKGPILAALYAAADLVRSKELACDIVFLIEGEEESGSQGFHEAIRNHKAQIGQVNWVLLANSYWLDDFNPCLTYGLRGVVHANLVVTSDYPDLHSGIDGSALLDEPLKDLSMLLASLVRPKGGINLPGFHDLVLPLTETEKSRYEAIADVVLPHHPEISTRDALIDSLMHRWREPALTIHSVEVPGSGSKSAATTIARRAKASLSIRIVPNQEADDVAASLTAFAQEQFALLESHNDLTVEITGKSDPWLGDPSNEIFGALSAAISAAWTTHEDLRSSHKREYSLLQKSADPAASATGDAAGAADGRAAASFRTSAALRRAGSSESLASHKERVISSITSSSRAKGRRQTDLRATVPTSSTLAMKAGGIETARAGDSPPGTESAAAAAVSSMDGSAPPATTSRHTAAIKPIYIREGGSIPTIRFLEKEFSAPAANVPCGQASDNAHLDNERLRVENLFKSREIFRAVFAGIAQSNEDVQTQACV